MATPEDLKRARAAMETDTHRRAREAKERAAREAKAALDAELAAADKERALEEKKRETIAQQQEQTEAEHKAEFEKKIAQAQRARNIAEQLKTRKLDISPIRTFKSDMARAVKEEGVSIAKIAMTQQAKNRLLGKEHDTNMATQKNRYLPVLLIVLILVIIGGGGWWWWQNRADQRPPVPAAVSTIIAAEIIETVDVDGSDHVAVRQAIHETFTSPEMDSTWTIKAVQFRQAGQILDFEDFRRTVDLSVPNDLRRHLSQSYLLGIYNNGEVKLPFLILTTRFHDSARAGLWDWEASMATDLLPVLRPEPIVPAELAPPFKDKLVRNKDARLLTNKAGHTLLFYAFLDKQTIAITRNEETFLELYDRFTNL